jgi:hypothetical protein
MIRKTPALASIAAEVPVFPGKIMLKQQAGVRWRRILMAAHSPGPSAKFAKPRQARFAEPRL